MKLKTLLDHIIVAHFNFEFSIEDETGQVLYKGETIEGIRTRFGNDEISNFIILDSHSFIITIKIRKEDYYVRRLNQIAESIKELDMERSSILKDGRKSDEIRQSLRNKLRWMGIREVRKKYGGNSKNKEKD